MKNKPKTSKTTGRATVPKTSASKRRKSTKKKTVKAVAAGKTTIKKTGGTKKTVKATKSARVSKTAKVSRKKTAETAPQKKELGQKPSPVIQAQNKMDNQADRDLLLAEEREQKRQEAQDKVVLELMEEKLENLTQQLELKQEQLQEHDDRLTQLSERFTASLEKELNKQSPLSQTASFIDFIKEEPMEEEESGQMALLRESDSELDENEVDEDENETLEKNGDELDLEGLDLGFQKKLSEREEELNYKATIDDKSEAFEIKDKVLDVEKESKPEADPKAKSSKLIKSGLENDEQDKISLKMLAADFKKETEHTEELLRELKMARELLVKRDSAGIAKKVAEEEKSQETAQALKDKFWRRGEEEQKLLEEKPLVSTLEAKQEAKQVEKKEQQKPVAEKKVETKEKEAKDSEQDKGDEEIKGGEEEKEEKEAFLTKDKVTKWFKNFLNE